MPMLFVVALKPVLSFQLGAFIGVVCFAINTVVEMKFADVVCIVVSALRLYVCIAGTILNASRQQLG